MCKPCLVAQWKPGSHLLPLLLIKTAQQTLAMMPIGHSHWCYRTVTLSLRTKQEDTGLIREDRVTKKWKIETASTSWLRRQMMCVCGCKEMQKWMDRQKADNGRKERWSVENKAANSSLTSVMVVHLFIHLLVAVLPQQIRGGWGKYKIYFIQEQECYFYRINR